MEGQAEVETVLCGGEDEMGTSEFSERSNQKATDGCA